MDKRTTFNEIISDYEFARPSYPLELYNDIAEFAMLKSDAKTLEIGSGTGQATEYFIKNGYTVTGLEIGDRQAEYLSKKYCEYKNFQSICSSFEEYNCAENSQNLIFSATAFHWIKAEIGYPKAYKLLKKNGVLSVFWHMSSIAKHETKIFDEIRKIYRKYAPELDNLKSKDEIESIHNLRITQVQTANLFNKPYYKVYRWNDEYTTEKYIKLLNTYSSFQVLTPNKRNVVLKSVAEYIDSKSGKIIVPQEVRLYMTRK